MSDHPPVAPLINCRHCFAEIPARASRCRHCGGNQRQTVFVVLVILCVVVVLCFVWHFYVVGDMKAQVASGDMSINPIGRIASGDMSINPITNTVTLKIAPGASSEAALLVETAGVAIVSKLVGPALASRFKEHAEERFDLYAMIIPWKVKIGLRKTEIIWPADLDYEPTAKSDGMNKKLVPELQAYLYSSNNRSVPVAATKDVLDEYHALPKLRDKDHQILRGKDNKGIEYNKEIEALYRSELMWDVRNGTRCEPIIREIGARVSEIIIKDGPHQGKHGWVYSSYWTVSSDLWRGQ